MQSKVIDKLFNLYVMKSDRYLIQYLGGNYKECNSNKINEKTSKKIPPLAKWRMEKHLEGSATIGVFAGEFYTKFFTLDVDFSKDAKLAKWIVYKIGQALDKYQIDYYISFSGGKGYHIDIFVEDLIATDTAKKFFDLVILESDIKEYFDDGNKVEFRPTFKQGVKIPLGTHQGTGAYCGFCEIENSLKIMSQKQSQNYIFTINKIKRQQILDILNDNTYSQDKIDKKQIIDTEEAISDHKPLGIYNPPDDFTIDNAIYLLNNGIQNPKSRHNTIFRIAAYLRYSGYELDDCIDILDGWMDSQDPKMYTTKIEDCYKDIREVVDYIFKNEVNIKPLERNIEITLGEINAIILSCPKKSQKLIAYSMLIHSKRYATKSGIFYMTFKQMAESTGLGESTAKRHINKLIELGVIEAVERDRRIKGQKKHLPNKYKVTLHIDDIQSDFTYVTDKQDDFNKCLTSYYTHNQLKDMLPRRHFEEVCVI